MEGFLPRWKRILSAMMVFENDSIRVLIMQSNPAYPNGKSDGHCCIGCMPMLCPDWVDWTRAFVQHKKCICLLA